LKVWPEIEVYGVGSVAKHRSSVSHYWLEVVGYVIDLTGDQYNKLSGKDIGQVMLKHRPFPKVHVKEASRSFLNILFVEKYRDYFSNGLKELASDTVLNLDYSYGVLYGNI
jgi:hypothetical protein